MKNISIPISPQEYIPQGRFMANIVKSMRARIRNPKVTVYSTKTTIEVSIPDDVEIKGVRKMCREIITEMLPKTDED